MTPDRIIIETLERLFDDKCEASVVLAAEQGVWPSELWEQLENTGLTLTWIPEEFGGAGAAMIDGFEVAKIAGRYAAPVPLVETLMAGWVLSQSELSVPTGPLCVVPGQSGARQSGNPISVDSQRVLTGVAERVSYARTARHLVVVTDAGVGLVEAASVEIVHQPGLSGDPYDQVIFEQTPVSVWSASGSCLGASVELLGATLRAQQMAGALERILSISLEYAGERSQFGRPIAKFQAVQHNLAVLAGEMAAAGAAANAAARCFTQYGADDARSFMAVASAKVRAGEAAGAGAAIAHQVHGAMGYTQEYSLNHFTRRLLSWRDDFGSEARWALELGQLIARRGADAVWPAITSI